jgi:hypothetical protein
MFGGASTFGQPQQQTAPFGAPAATGFAAGGFGASAAPQTNVSVNMGTGAPAYLASNDVDTSGASRANYQSVTYMSAYANWSFEVLSSVFLPFLFIAYLIVCCCCT